MIMDSRDPHFGQLPWGWWLRVRGSLIEDDLGRTWRTVRDAFWQGELGFPPSHCAPEQHELLARVLTSVDARTLAGWECQHDLFGGDMLFWRFYQWWLWSIGLLESAHADQSEAYPFEAPLSPKGRSVMLMLLATRDPEWERLPMVEVVEAVSAARRGVTGEARQAALSAFERSVGRRRYLFAREQVGSSFLVTLTGIAVEARMPTMRVAWSQSFRHAHDRDDFFAWLAERVERWDDWGRIAHRSGAEALTRHLFTLVLGGVRLKI